MALIRAPQFLNPATPRCGFCMVHHLDKIYLWGGLTQTLNLSDGEDAAYPEDHALPDPEDPILDEYDIQDNCWHTYKTTDDIPDYGKGSTMVGYKNYLFLFGGWNEEEFANEVHRLDLNTFEWKILEVGEDSKPSPRYLTNAIVFESLMCIFGGTGPTIDPAKIQPGAEYIELQQYGHSYGFGWNNEMFFFDLEKHCWSAPRLGDRRPPPCSGFTFTMVDSHRAMLFGGKEEERRTSDIHIFDFHTMKWGDVICQKEGSEEPWPSGRSFHSATCLVDPGRIEEHRAATGVHMDQQLLILWGKGDDSRHCNDAWIYNLDRNKWKKVSEFHRQDDELKARMWHMACSHFLSTTRSDTILFGGNKQRKSNREINSMHDLTILSFGVIELKVLCLEAIRRHGLEKMLDERVSYVAKNQFTDYSNATFYQFSL